MNYVKDLEKMDERELEKNMIAGLVQAFHAVQVDSRGRILIPTTDEVALQWIKEYKEGNDGLQS